MESLKEAWWMFKRRYAKPKFFKGTPRQIADEIVKKCFNGVYFQTSLGHFSCFWMRDFGICCEALMNLGYEKEVYKTLQYALTMYSRNNILTTTISHENKPFDVFTYSPDTLPLVLRALRIANATDLVEIYKPFLYLQIMKYYQIVIQEETGLVKKTSFSSMKDNAVRKSSCYDNCMAAMCKEELNKLKLENPLNKYDYKKLIKENFWQGYYFYDDLYSNYVAGDANVFPFWCEIFDDREMLGRIIKTIHTNKLDDPFPLKYTSTKSHTFKLLLRILANNYQGNTIWMNIGLCYLDIVAKYDKKLLKAYLDTYTEVIERHKNFLEVFNADGTPYQTPFYKADEGMLWAAKYLDLLRKAEAKTIPVKA